MTPELWERLKPLFHEALERNADQRSAFIDEACAEDSELRSNLKMLLDAEAETTEVSPAFFVANGSFSHADDTRFQVGETVLGRFRVVRLIGRGGMGEVYEADDLQLGRVALKTIRGKFEPSTDAFVRFRQEVLLARKITGPQICRIHEFFLIPATNGHRATAFLTMEYLDGNTLAARLAKDGRLPWHEARQVALDLCEGLRLIHAEGIIHRDLKTGNIMLCNHGKSVRTVLMDFGLAMNAEVIERENGNGSSVSEEGWIVGTPEYMAPEQFESGPVSPATDIYALGVILYEMVTGVHPYAAHTPIGAAIRRARHPASPSTVGVKVPPHLDRIIECCLEYEPSKRFQSAEEVARELRAGPANLRYLHRDRPWVFRAACALALVLATWGGVHWWRARQYYRPSTEALHWYDSGLSALREGNYVKATRALEQATNKDPQFVMAHARLAEAWYELDFQGNAQRELLIAEPEAYRLVPLDRMYLNAIQATITHDYPRGIEHYRTILTRLPTSSKADGYIDLGKAYERAGDPPRALQNYAQAARISADNPASFLHTAVLQSRLHHVPEADRAFQRAESLFSAEMNQEGLAELDYARGYASNDTGNSLEAKKFLERSFEEASKLPSIQLEIRALTQLSSAAYEFDTAQAEKYAEQAIRLARENQLDAWAADGLVRLASAEIHHGNLQGAEDALEEALQIAQQTKQLRAEALANLTLASLMNQKQLPDKVIEPAQKALAYYQKNGYFVPAANASILIIRAQRDKRQFQQALEAGNAFLILSTKSGIHPLMMQAEEAIGSIYLLIEEYPQALAHFQNSNRLADSASMRSYQQLNCANALWRLGRYSESDSLFQSLLHEPTLSKDKRFMERVGRQRATSLLSRRDYKAALLLSTEMLDDDQQMPSGIRREFTTDKAIAESHLGMNNRALSDLLILANENNEDPEDKARARLAAAEIYLALKMADEAYGNAVGAESYFASSSQHDSELRSAYLAAFAAKSLKRKPEYSAYSVKIVDIQNYLQHTWEPHGFQSYLSRPDLHTLRQEVQETAR